MRPEVRHSNIGSTLAAARGIAVFIAILWHTDIWIARHYPNYSIYENTFRVLWYIPLPTFFLLIGIAFAKLIERNRIVLIANAISLYIYLYLFWLLAYHIVFTIIGQEDYGSGVLPFIRKIIFPAPELWFVVWISFCLLLCSLTRRLPKLLQIATSFLLLLVILEPGYKIQNLMIYNLFFMYLGIVCRDKFLYYVGNHSLKIASFCIPLYLISAYYRADTEPFSHPTMSVIQSCFGVCGLVSSLHVYHKTNIVKYCSSLGRNSLHIYIISPLCLALDLRSLSWSESLQSRDAEYIIQLLTLPLCIFVFGQALLIINLIDKSWAFNPPAPIRRVIESGVSLALSRLTILPFGSLKGVIHRNSPPNNG